MKLLLLTTGCIISGICFSQQLKPEIKELIQNTELNVPTGLVHDGNNRLQKFHSSTLIYKKPVDTMPTYRIINLPKDWQIFDSRSHVFSDNHTIMLRNRSVNQNIPGVYLLPQDNMPCIVPDTKNITPIPNFWQGKVESPYRSKIPNSALPRIFTLPKGLIK